MTRPIGSRFFHAALAVAVILAGAPAAGWIAQNGMATRSDPERAGVFEVFHYPRAWSQDYWCAAGDHVYRSMGFPPNTRVYLVRGPGPSRIRPGQKSAIFTVVPGAALADLAGQVQGYSLTIEQPGFNLSAGHARARCRDSRRHLRGRWF